MGTYRFENLSFAKQYFVERISTVSDFSPLIDPTAASFAVDSFTTQNSVEVSPIVTSRILVANTSDGRSDRQRT